MWQYIPTTTNEIYHYGVKGMKWGVIRYLDKLKSRITSRTASTSATAAKATASQDTSKKEAEKPKQEATPATVGVTAKAGMAAAKSAMDAIKKEEKQARDEFQKKTEMEAEIAAEEIKRDLQNAKDKANYLTKYAQRNEDGSFVDKTVEKFFVDYYGRADVKDLSDEKFQKAFKDYYVAKKMAEYDSKKSSSDDAYRSDLIKKHGEATVKEFYDEVLPRYKENPIIKTLLKG